MSGNLAPVLFQYDVYPNKIETIGNIKKLYTPRGTYALKETKMTTEERLWFVHVLERLHRLGFDRFVAPFPSKSGGPLTVHEGRTYYLMPWLNGEDTHILSPEEQLIEAGAALHLLTEKEQRYSDEVVQSSYDGLVKRWSAHEEEFENFAAKAEDKIYFSPFELSYLSFFREAMQAADAAKHHLSRWLELSKENKRYRVVLCHGRLSTGHFVDGCLLNFEHAVLDSPVRDLAMLFRGTFMQGRATEAEDPFDWLQTYGERFPLREEEKMLLAAYLTFPEAVCRSIREYRDPLPEENELIRVQKLEYRFQRSQRLRRLADRMLQEMDG